MKINDFTAISAIITNKQLNHLYLSLFTGILVATPQPPQPPGSRASIWENLPNSWNLPWN